MNKTPLTQGKVCRICLKGILLTQVPLKAVQGVEADKEVETPVHTDLYRQVLPTHG